MESGQGTLLTMETCSVSLASARAARSAGWTKLNKCLLCTHFREPNRTDVALTPGPGAFHRPSSQLRDAKLQTCVARGPADRACVYPMPRFPKCHPRRSSTPTRASASATLLHGQRLARDLTRVFPMQPGSIVAEAAKLP